jgi:hypothetical protein
MTGEKSRALKVGTRVCWQNDQTDRGTVTETNWAGLTIRWDSRGDQSQRKARRHEPAGCRNQTHAAIFAEMIPVTISATNRSWSSRSSISRSPQYQRCNTAAFASRSEAIPRLTAIALRGPASSKAKPKGERK